MTSDFGWSKGFLKGLLFFGGLTGLISDDVGGFEIVFIDKIDANSSLTAIFARTVKVSLCFYGARFIGWTTLFMSEYKGSS